MVLKYVEWYIAKVEQKVAKECQIESSEKLLFRMHENIRYLQAKSRFLKHAKFTCSSSVLE